MNFYKMTIPRTIEKSGFRSHQKASERYVDVVFVYDHHSSYKTSVPLEYRRTATDISNDDTSAIDAYLLQVGTEINPAHWDSWRGQQQAFWDTRDAQTTKAFFDVLAEDFGWRCVSCDLPPNPNWARRVQDLKEFGYTLATNTKLPCTKCEKNTTHIILLPIKRGGASGYETWSPELRNRILDVLGSVDAFEAKQTRKEGLLPDHKFPEIRWDQNTRRESLSGMTDEQIRADFQLLSNQRNQQKREVCRKCYQTGSRGVIYGIRFFYEGGEIWDASIPKQGKDAEKGCIGCGWYDISKWRESLEKRLLSSSPPHPRTKS